MKVDSIEEEYGTVTDKLWKILIECMPLGKPVIAYIREDLKDKYPPGHTMPRQPINIYL